jgi:hypothetical protein
MKGAHMEFLVLLLLFGAVLAGLLVLAGIHIWRTAWAQVRQAEIDARAKQDMLARGMSVGDIERLLTISSRTAPGAGRLDAAPQERPSNVALRLATAIEDMVAVEKDTEQIETFLETFLLQGGECPELGTGPTQLPESAEASGRRSDLQRLGKGLAPALESMVQNGRATQEIAAFLDTILHKSKGFPEVGKDRDQPPPLAPRPAAEDFRLQDYSIRPSN